MRSLNLLADMSPLPILIGAGLILIVISGLFLSLAVLIVGGIKRRRNRNKPSAQDKESTQ